MSQTSPTVVVAASPVLRTTQTEIVSPATPGAQEISVMEAAAEQASCLLKALSHPLRLLLLCHLSQGERCVSDLEKLVRLGQPSLSQQLGVLRAEGLVNTRRDGKHIYYSVASQEALQVLDTLYAMYCGPASPVR